MANKVNNEHKGTDFIKNCFPGKPWLVCYLFRTKDSWDWKLSYSCYFFRPDAILSSNQWQWL